MRLRSNFQTGKLGAALTDGVGTTITFAVAPSFATIVSPDYIVLELEPNAPGAAPGNAEIVYLTAYTAAATTGTITRAQEGTTGVAHSNSTIWTHGATAADFLQSGSYFVPNTALAETFSRDLITVNVGPLVSGTLYLTAITLPANLVIGHIAFASSGGAAGTPTNWWFGLYNSAFVQLAVTADQLTAAWASQTAKSLAIATIASGASTTFTTTYTGVHYLGIMMKATTGIITAGPTTVLTPMLNLAPIPGGLSDTAQTAPPAFAHTATSLTGVTGEPRIYGYVAT